MDQNFVDLLLENIQELRKDVRSLNLKVDQIIEYKNRIWGGAVILSFLVTVLIQIGIRFLN